MLLDLLFACATPLVLLARGVAAQDTFSFFANASDIYPPPTDPQCAEALASTINCPSILLDATPSDSLGISNLTASDLQSVCTQSCYTSLMNVAAEVNSACQAWPYIVGDTSYVASLPFLYAAYYWNLVCVVRTSDSKRKLLIFLTGLPI